MLCNGVVLHNNAVAMPNNGTVGHYIDSAEQYIGILMLNIASVMLNNAVVMPNNGIVGQYIAGVGHDGGISGQGGGNVRHVLINQKR